MKTNNTQANTILTCEGIACGRCRINVELCQCQPNGFRFKAMSERISGQGLVPETMMEAA
jgi:hypothetical protein